MKNPKQMFLVAAIAAVAFVAGQVYAAKKAGFINRAADQMQFKDSGVPGITQSDLWGNSNKGAHGALTKFAAGTKVPLHMHSHDLKAIVLAGTMVFSGADGVETKLGPGSYRFEPAGLMHVTACAAGADCELVEIQSGAFDVKLAEAAK